MQAPVISSKTLTLTFAYTMILALTPFMVGTLTGFLMLDEKDGNVTELILVTPVGNCCDNLFGKRSCSGVSDKHTN